MGKKNKKDNPQQAPENNVIVIERCKSEDCNSRAKRASFCEEHFRWFKEGLITREGQKVKDFDKKHIAFRHRKTAA